jgi:TolB-like protein/tetratricopeptide (TPR) repeat protein
LSKALAVSPVDRFPSVDAFAEALDAALARGEVGRTTTVRRRPIMAVGLVVALSAILGLAYWRWGTTLRGSNELPRVVVVPFESRGTQDDRDFADGVSDAVRGQLATSSQLEVVERASSASFAGTGTPLKRVADELAARYLLAGTVRRTRTDSQVVIRAELLEHDGDQLRMVWSDDVTGHTRDVFALQTQVAERVARVLDASLRGTLRLALQVGTRNIEAHEAFLRGERLGQHGAAAVAGSIKEAEREYAQAVAIDPGFRLAWSRLAWARAFLLASDGRPEFQALVRATIDSARKYAPDEPFTALAALIGERFIGGPERGLVAARESLRQYPNDALLLAQTATVHFALGAMDSAKLYVDRARRRDPRSAVALVRTALVYNALRDYAGADSAAQLVLTIEPGHIGMHYHRVVAALGRGDTALARQRVDEAVADVNQTPAAMLGGILKLDIALAWVLRPQQHDILLRADSSNFSSFSKALLQFDLLTQRGDTASARALLMPLLRLPAPNRSTSATRRPASPPPFGIALLLAFAGRCPEAVDAVQRRLTDDRIRPDYMGFNRELTLAAQALTWCGARDDAVNVLERVLTTPGSYSGKWIAADPRFAPLRGHPRFEALIRS